MLKNKVARFLWDTVYIIYGNTSLLAASRNHKLLLIGNALKIHSMLAHQTNTDRYFPFLESLNITEYRDKLS
jgi:hypothetical protein